MRNDNIKDVLFWVVVLNIAIAINSCGSTKKYQQEQSSLKQNQTLVVTEGSENTYQNVKIETTQAKDASSQTVKVKKTYTPILPDKKAVAIDSQGKRVELENASLVEETILYQNKEKVQQSSKTEALQNKAIKVKQDHKTKTTKKVKELDKVVDRKGIHFSVWIWLILVIIAVLVIIYLKYRFKWFFDVTTFLNK